ncbi:MAG: hypothetical protein AB1553_09505 [Nitrospirota bacterium]
MSDRITFSQLAILYELNDRELKRKLTEFPEELHYYVILASSIIGAENSKRVKETPPEVIQSSEEFASKLMELTSAIPDTTFRNILETCLIETLKDELRFNCPNCRDFNRCLDLEHLPVGDLFQRRVQGEETEGLKKEISAQIAGALKKTPHIATDEAHLLCRDFVHNYSSTSVGGVFGRYADIAAALRQDFGIDYAKIQQQMVELNMQFFEKSKRHTH